ncbi:replication-associated protein [Dragonfly cyclovirus 2]|uniref:Replication-associated protein n=1 Tax=Dragonfly cyclovirus 2 TaxID=1234880 RepID=K0A2H8_9CIRC|nr:replication-associated protein [Dragonfly cyclovirus 2]AFS65288.1 replication-associated protein [Dragonfly cyclovirus 2]
MGCAGATRAVGITRPVARSARSLSRIERRLRSTLPGSRSRSIRYTFNSMNSTLRRFCFTVNNYDAETELKVKNFLTNNCKYGIYGRELCPTTKTPHLQGFANLSKPMRFRKIKESLCDTAHIEKANGSDEDNKTYCSKSGEFFETGSPCQQGRRSDLDAVVATISTGERDIRRIAEKHPNCYIRYGRGIRSYLELVNPIPPRYFKTRVVFFYGPPGSGKSRRALAEAQAIDPDSIYYKPRGEWWDGYHQQTSVIIDDFYGWIKYDDLLKICDRYPYKVPIKGGFQEFTSKHIWITSNVDTPLLYKFENYNVAALERRLEIKELIE